MARVMGDGPGDRSVHPDECKVFQNILEHGASLYRESTVSL
jgi:hypothetical protein